MAPDAHSQTERAFLHSALIIDSDEVVRKVLAPAIEQALSEADGVFVAVSDDTKAMLDEQLGPATARVEWGDTAAFYQRMGFAYESFRLFLAEQRDLGRSLHVFAEPDVASGMDDASPVDRAAAYLVYESMCNETYEDYGCEVTCVWDARRHPTVVIENVRRLHNHEVRRWGLEPSPDYVDPEEYLAGRSGLPLEVPPGVDWEATVTRPEHFLGLRDDLRDWARRRGFKPSAAADVVVAVNEVATNGFLHGQPPVRVCAWHHGRTLVIQVDDQGGTPIPAFAGYRPPQARQESEYGLWLARQLADVVQTYTDGPTTSVRLHFPYDLSHRNPPRLS